MKVGLSGIPTAGFVLLLAVCDVAGQAAPVGEGLASLRRGEYEAAVRTLRPQARDGDPVALSGLVTALRESGEYEDAQEAARRGVEDGVAGASALLGRSLLDTGELAEARTVLEQGSREGGTGGARARLHLAVLEYWYGDRERSYDLFDTFIDYYNSAADLGYLDLTTVGEGLVYLSRRSHPLAHDALRALDEAVAAGPTDHRARLATGRLFLERYDAAQAAESFNEVLQENPEHPEALLGLAMVVQLEGGGDSASLLEQALEGNPRLAGARTHLARVRLMGGDRAGALEEVGRALDVNPADLEALATRAAIHYLAKDDAAYRSQVARIESLSPAPTRAYELLSEISSDHRKYQDALDFARRSADVDSTAWAGLGLMGLNQVRLGRVEAGRANLERAFAGDPFNLWFKNTLDLLDTFAEYRIVETEHFRFVLHESEADLLAPYIGPLAERAWQEMSERYQYRPTEPIRVEVYPRHEDFSVRTVGLVGIGALGVSFGPALAMDSPTARGKGEFNWASTLWHEIAHSFHLGVSDHEVPRWFSEGLAVHEQRKGNPTWGHQASPGFIRALAEEELRPVSELDRGFSHPRRPSEVVESYYLASLVFEVIEERHGFPAIVEMLRAYRDGAGNAEAFRRALGVDLEDFDEEFDAFLKERFDAAIESVGQSAPLPQAASNDIGAARQAVAANPRGFAPRMALATALYRSGDLEDAARHFEAALELFPQYGGPDGPHWFLGRIREQQGRAQEAEAHYRSLLALNESHYDARQALGELLLSEENREGAARVLAELPYVHPYEIEDHRSLAELFESVGEWDGAITEREAVLALNPVDRANAHYLLARTHLQAGHRSEARTQVLQALEIAPNYEEALDLLLELRSGSGER